MRIEFNVFGLPKGQPRARAFAFGGKAGKKVSVRMYDPGTAEGWKSCVAIAARDHLPPEPIAGPVALTLLFRFPRPKSHFTKKGLRPDAPIYVTSKPDADNAAKAVMDCLTQLGAWKDDAQIVALDVTKVYGDRPGCSVWLWTLPLSWDSPDDNALRLEAALRECVAQFGREHAATCGRTK